MGKKSLRIALATVYSSIYKATTIPLIYTSIFLGNALFVEPCFAKEPISASERTSYSILKKLPSFVQEYNMLPLYNGVNSTSEHGPFYMVARIYSDTQSKQNIFTTQLESSIIELENKIPFTYKEKKGPKLHEKILFDLEENEKGQRLTLYQEDSFSKNAIKNTSNKEYMLLHSDIKQNKKIPTAREKKNIYSYNKQEKLKDRKSNVKKKEYMYSPNFFVKENNSPELRIDIQRNLSFNTDTSIDMTTYETILAGRYDIINVTMNQSGRLSITRSSNRVGGHVEMGNIKFNGGSYNRNHLILAPQKVSLEMIKPIVMGTGHITFEAVQTNGFVLVGRKQEILVDANASTDGSKGLTISFLENSYVHGNGNLYSLNLNKGDDTVSIHGRARVDDLKNIAFGEGNNEFILEKIGGQESKKIHGEMSFGSGHDKMRLQNMVLDIDSVNLWHGHNTIELRSSGIKARNIRVGTGNDSIYMDNGYFQLNEKLELNSGDDTLHIIRSNVYAPEINTGNGNDSIILSIFTIPVLRTGAGNDTVHFLENQKGVISNIIYLEGGNNLIRLDKNVSYEPNILSVIANSTVTLDLGENATVTTPSNFKNEGLFNINLNNKSHYRGQGNITTGRVHARILDGSQMHTGLTTGSGNDTLFISQGTIDGSVNLGSGNNSIVLDRSTMTTNGNRVYMGAGSSSLELRNTVSFLGTNSSILLEGGTYSVNIKDLNMDQNIANISMTGKGNNSVLLEGNIVRMGSISTGNGNSSVHFSGTKTTAGNIGTITMGTGQDIVRINSGSVMESLVNLGSSGNGADSIIVEDTSKIGLGANLSFTGNLSFTAKDNSIVDAILNLPGKSTILLQDSANFNNGFFIDTEEQVILNASGKSVFDGNIIVNENKAIRFEITGEDKAVINDDVITGNMDDFVSVILSNDARIGGSVVTGLGNDTLRLRLESTFGIEGLDMGEGNDLVEILGGVISGTTRSFVLGTGNNTVSILGNTTINGGIMIDIPAVNTFLIDNGNILTSDIFTGVSEGILNINRGGVLEGTMNGATRLTVNLKGNSTITGNISAGTEDANVLIEQSFVGGNVESNQGGDLSFIARNSTVQGGITSTALGVNVNTHIELFDSLIRGDVTSEDITLSSSRSVLEGTLKVQGASVINLSNSTLNGGISTSTGNANIIATDTKISGGISVSKGEHVMNLTGGSVVGGIVLSNSTATIIANNVAIKGNITLMPSGGLPFATGDKGNSIFISGGSLDGSIVGDRDIANNSVKLTSTRVTGGIHLGIGENTAHIDNSIVDGILEIRNADMLINNKSVLNSGIRFEGMSNTIIQDSTINGTLDFSSKTLGTQIVSIINSSYKGDLRLGNALNTFTLEKVVTKGNIYGGQFSDSLELIGSTIYGDIQLGSEQDTLSLSGGTQIFGKEIRSNTINVKGSVIFRDSSASDFILSNNSGMDGKMFFHQGGNVLLNPGFVGDTLLVEGRIENSTSGTNFRLDTNFYTAETDSIRIAHGTEITGNRIMLRFTPSHIIDGSEALIPLIENVIITEKAIMASPSVIGGSVAVGGYLYNLVPNEYATGWNLEIGGKNPANGGYAATVVSNKNYSRVMWENISERITNGLLGRGTLPEKGSENEKGMPLGDHFSVWSNVQVSINSIDGPALPDMSENLVLASVGADLKNITISSKDQFSFSAFGAYGVSKSDLQHEKTIKFSSDLEAFSVGVNGLWENLRGKKAHRLFMTAALWGDIYRNTLFSPYSSVEQSWNTYALNASVGLGYRMVLGRFSFIPQAELLYTYAKGNELIAEDQSLIIFQDEHRIVLKTGALFAYNFDFGLKPYIRVGLEVPLASISNGSGTSIAGEEYKYDTDAVLTRMGFGLNYTVQVSGLEINTFVDTFLHIGREEGINANMGLSIGF